MSKYKGKRVQKLLYILLSLAVYSTTVFAVDATLKIEKDVEQRARISLVDGSSIQDQRVFNIYFLILKYRDIF